MATWVFLSIAFSSQTRDARTFPITNNICFLTRRSGYTYTNCTAGGKMADFLKDVDALGGES